VIKIVYLFDVPHVKLVESQQKLQEAMRGDSTKNNPRLLAVSGFFYTSFMKIPLSLHIGTNKLQIM